MTLKVVRSGCYESPFAILLPVQDRVLSISDLGHYRY